MSELSYMPDGTPTFELTADDPWSLDLLRRLRERCGRNAELEEAIKEFEEHREAYSIEDPTPVRLCAPPIETTSFAPTAACEPYPQPKRPLIETWYERVQAIRERKAGAAPGPYAEGIRAFRKALDRDGR